MQAVRLPITQAKQEHMPAIVEAISNAAQNMHIEHQEQEPQYQQVQQPVEMPRGKCSMSF